VPIGGSVGQVLTKTGAGDYATGWATAAAASASPAFLAETRAALSVTAGTPARVPLVATGINHGGWFANNVWTPQIAGIYLVGGMWNNNTSADDPMVSFRKNNADIAQLTYLTGGQTYKRLTGTAMVAMNGSTDFLDLCISFVPVNSNFPSYTGSIARHMWGFLVAAT
jgi:hypothetical protein